MIRATSIMLLLALAPFSRAALMTTDVTRVRPERALADELRTLVIEHGALVSNANDPMDLRIGDGVTPGGVRIGIPVPLSTDFSGRTIYYGEGWSSGVFGIAWRLVYNGSPILTISERAVNAVVTGVSFSSNRVYVATAWDPEPRVDTLVLRWTDGSGSWIAITNDVTVVVNDDTAIISAPRPPSNTAMFSVSYLSVGPTLRVKTAVESEGLTLDGRIVTNWAEFAAASALAQEQGERIAALASATNLLGQVQSAASGNTSNLLQLWQSYSNTLDGGISLAMIDTASLDTRYATTSGVAAAYLSRTGGVVSGAAQINELWVGGSNSSAVIHLWYSEDDRWQALRFGDDGMAIDAMQVLDPSGVIPLARMDPIMLALTSRVEVAETAIGTNLHRLLALSASYSNTMGGGITLGNLDTSDIDSRYARIDLVSSSYLARTGGVLRGALTIDAPVTIGSATNAGTLHLHDGNGGIMPLRYSAGALYASTNEVVTDSGDIPYDRIAQALTARGVYSAQGDIVSTNAIELGGGGGPLSAWMRIAPASSWPYLFRPYELAYTGAFQVVSRDSSGENLRMYMNDREILITANDDETIPLRVRNGIAVYGGNSPTTSIMTLTVTGGLRVGSASFHAEVSGDVYQDATNTAHMGMVRAVSLALGQGDPITDFSRYATGSPLYEVDTAWVSNGLASLQLFAAATSEIATNTSAALGGLESRFAGHTNDVAATINDLDGRVGQVEIVAADARDDAARIESNLTYMIVVGTNAQHSAVTAEVARLDGLFIAASNAIYNLQQALGGLDFAWASNGLSAIGGVATGAMAVATNADAIALNIIVRHEAWTNVMRGWMSDMDAAVNALSNETESVWTHFGGLNSNVVASLDAATNNWYALYTNEAALRAQAIDSLSNALAQLDAAIGIVSNLTVNPDASLLGGYSEAAFMRESSWQAIQSNVVRIVDAPRSNSAPGGVGRRASEYRDGQMYEYAWYSNARGTNTPGWIRTPPGTAAWTNAP